MLANVNKITITLLLLSCSTASLAGPGGVVFGPVSTVPTMSGTMLIILSIFLAFIAFKVMKQRAENKTTLWVTILGTGALLSATGGFHLFDKATASVVAIPITPNITMPLNPTTFNTYRNDTSTPLQVKSITGSCAMPSGMPLCTVGRVVAPAGTCDINCSNP